MRLSGLQRGVLSLYRQCLRETRKKPAVCHLLYEAHYIKAKKKSNPSQDVRENFKGFARTEFERNIGLDKKDFAAIEYLLRKGQRQLENYSSPGIRNIMR